MSRKRIRFSCEGAAAFRTLLGLHYKTIYKKGDDPFGYRAEFIALIYKAKMAAFMPAQGENGGGYENTIYVTR